MAQHRAILGRFRQQEDPAIAIETPAEELPDHRMCDEGVELVEEGEETMLFSDPVSYAKHLCEQADLTRGQRGPVAFLAKDMKKVCIQEVERRAQLTEAQRRSEGLDATDVVRPPLVGRRV